MRPRPGAVWFAFAPLLLLSGVCVPAALAAPETVSEIDACVRANLPEATSRQSVVMRAKDRVGSVTETRAEVFWKKFDDDLSRALLRFSAPPDLQGAGLLVIEQEGRNDMFMYLPELRRVKRVTGRMVTGSMFGTDFTYEQFERMQGMADDASTQREPDAEVAGRPVYVLVHVPEAELGAPSERVVTYVDQEKCVALKAEFYESGETLRRVLEVDPDRVLRSGVSWVPRRLVMKDVRDGTETELEVEQIETDVDIPRRVFTQSALEQGH